MVLSGLQKVLGSSSQEVLPEHIAHYGALDQILTKSSFCYCKEDNRSFTHGDYALDGI